MKDNPILHEIDRACLSYFDAFGIRTEDSKENNIIVRGTELSLGMSAIHITYRDHMQPHDNLAEVNPSRMGMGKPSVEIRTWDVDSGSAVYNFHISLGIVIVNNFDFPMGEVRDLRPSEKKAIDASIETRGCYDNLMSRVLKPVGIVRIVSDIDNITMNTGWYVQELAGDAGTFIDPDQPEPLADSL